jgi:hypothetical protein
MFAIGGFVWSSYLYFQASGSSSRRKKREQALIFMCVFGIVLILQGIIALIWQTDAGKVWLSRFLS